MDEIRKATETEHLKRWKKPLTKEKWRRIEAILAEPPVGYKGKMFFIQLKNEAFHIHLT